MKHTDILRRYQAFDPDTGRFDCGRGLREYARLLGMDAGHLSRILNAEANPGRTVLERLARLFPDATPEIAAALAAPAPVAETEALALAKVGVA